jgi:hypothetical protein
MLLLLTLVVGVVMGWLIVPVHRARQQHAAIEALRESGWEIKCEPSESSPRWLRRAFGEEIFVDAVRVTSPATSSDAEMIHLRCMRKLRSLHIASPHVTDAGISSLKGLSELEHLYLCKCQIGDEGLERLRNLRRLKRLYLSYTQVTDDGLVHLTGLTGLRQLHLYGTGVTDEGVDRLQKDLADCTIWH